MEIFKRKFPIGLTVLSILLVILVMNTNIRNVFEMNLTLESHAANSKQDYFSKYGGLNRTEWSKLAVGIWRNKSTGESLIFTEPYSLDIVGYNDVIPLLIRIDSNDIITGIEVLPNRETPPYMARIKRKGMIKKYIGMSVDSIMGVSVDVVTSATYSSHAIQSSIKRGVIAYTKRDSNRG